MSQLNEIMEEQISNILKWSTLEEIMDDEEMQFECTYHNYLMKLVFGELNPMLYNEKNPEHAKKLFKKVGSLSKKEHNKEACKVVWSEHFSKD